MTIRKFNLVWIPSLMLLLMGLFFYVGSAEAGSEKWRSSWDVAGDFVGNNINVVLTVTVERKSGAFWNVYGVESYQLACTQEGSVLLANDMAEFDNTGIIQCEMPSIQEIVKEMTEGRFIPNAKCTCTPTIFADVILDPNTTSAPLTNPIVTRMHGAQTDLALAAPVPLYSTIPSASMIFTVGNEVAQSASFFANGVPNSLMATYFDMGLTKQSHFVANGAAPGSLMGPVPKPNLVTHNSATTLYIGYSPETNSSLQGTLESFLIDPACYGTG